MGIEVQVATQSENLPSVAHLEACATLAMNACNRLDHDLCLRMVDHEESRALNARYRGKDKSTNVLSFPAEVDIAELPILGDLVLCAPVVESEAQVQGKTVADHYAHMVVHGVLHLCGYDHENDVDAAEMEALEVALLDRLDIQDPYR